MQVNWAQGAEGRKQLQQIFTNSGALNGDAVVVFIRAVCAVSQEELVPTTSDLPPRSMLASSWQQHSLSIGGSSTFTSLWIHGVLHTRANMLTMIF